MLSEKSFYSDGSRAYIITKMTPKTVTFTPVKSEYLRREPHGSAYLFNVLRRATDEIDEDGKSLRFRKRNNVSKKDLAVFYENKDGRMTCMYELEDDTFGVEHNYR